MTDNYKIVNDAGETILVSRRPLEYVEREVMERFRPKKWREFLQVDSSAPEWADSVSYDVMKQYAEWVPAQSFTSDFAMATAEKSTFNYPLYEMVSGWEYFNREMLRAKETKTNLDVTRADAVMKKGEDVLEHLAANGTIDGTKALGSCKGILNQTSVTIDTDASAATTSWHDLSYTTEAEMQAFVEKVVSDFLIWESKIEVATKETFMPDTALLPLNLRQIFQRVAPGYGGQTVEQVVLRRLDRIDKLGFWAKNQDAGAGGLDRVALYSRKDPESAKFVLPKAPTPGRRFQDMYSVKTPVGMVVGGVQTKATESLIYCDIADAS